MKNLFLCAVSLALMTVMGCGGDKAEKARGDRAGSSSLTVTPDTDVFDHDAEPPPPPPGGRPVTAYRDGVATEMTEGQAPAEGLTVIDLSNYWVPFIFSERDGPDEERLPNEFRPIYRKLANDWHYESRTMAEARKVVELRIERARNARIFELREEGMSEEKIRDLLGLEQEDAGVGEDVPDAGPKSGAGDSEHFLEVYGIPPSLSVLRRRAVEEIDRPCYDEVDFEAIKRFDGFVSYRSNEAAKAEAKKGRTFADKMRDQMEKLGVEDPLELASNPGNKMSGGLIRIAMRYEAMVEAQKLLVCEGLFDLSPGQYYRKGALDWKTHQALSAFEKKNRIFAWGFFGKETLQALQKTPPERLYDSFNRVVAERIVDAMGIIEDGSAVDAQGKKATYKDEKGEVHPVPNLVALYTAHLLRHMDLGAPRKVVDFLKAASDSRLDRFFVAVPFPSLPPYYSDRMELKSIIDRGDVWYDYLYTPDGKKRGQSRKRMPMNTLLVRWNGQDIPLVTMNTTIGSWRTELAPDGYEYYKYKNSDVGERVWKDIIAGPVWLPPETTPVGDMVKTVSFRGRKVRVPNYDEFGPWYGSAYGLVVAFHERQIERKNGEFRYLDNGIRSHGSVDYNSILRRYSHGCHRLYNHLAIRLFDFVLRHVEFRRVGQTTAGFSRKGEVDGESFTVTLRSRGYKYELSKPVPVEVLRGRVRGTQRSPIEHYMPKPDVEYGDDAQFLPPEYRKNGGPGADAGVAAE